MQEQLAGRIYLLVIGKKLLHPNRKLYYFEGQRLKVLRDVKEHKGGIRVSHGRGVGTG